MLIKLGKHAMICGSGEASRVLSSGELQSVCEATHRW